MQTGVYWNPYMGTRTGTRVNAPQYCVIQCCSGHPVPLRWVIIKALLIVNELEWT